MFNFIQNILIFFNLHKRKKNMIQSILLKKTINVQER